MNNTISHFKTVRNNFFKIIDKIPVKNQNIKITDHWTLKEIMSHLIGWANFQINVVTSIIENKTILQIPKIQEFNKDSVKKYKTSTNEEVYFQLIKTTNQLIIAYSKLPENKWQQPIWKNKKTTPEKLLTIETKHYMGEHLKQIENIIQKN